MEEPRIRAATADDVSAITQIVGQAYRHYIARIGKPPARADARRLLGAYWRAWYGCLKKWLS